MNRLSVNEERLVQVRLLELGSPMVSNFHAQVG